MLLNQKLTCIAPTGATPEHAEFRRLYYAGELAEARRLAEEGYEEGRERVLWVNSLALVAAEQGNLREAYSLYLTHAELLTDCPNLYAVANFHLNYGFVGKRLFELHRLEEYFDRASIAFTAAAYYFTEAESDSCVAYAENCFANLLIVAGRAAEAFEHIDVAALLFNNAGERARVADCEDTRSLAYEALGQYVDAFECSSRAVVSLERMGKAEAKSLKQARETHARVFAKMAGVLVGAGEGEGR